MSRYKVDSTEEKKKKRGNAVLRAVFVIALIVFAVSGGMLMNELVIQPWIANKNLNDYRHLKPNTSANLHTTSSTASADTASAASGGADDAPAQMLESFRALYERNADIAGWLTIPGTALDHPVFYTPNDQNYYLKRNADGEDDKYGSLYLSAGSTLEPQAQVMVMYGHNMEQDDLMFGQLNKFKKLKFLQQHPTFTFDTIYRTGTWKIIAVCRASTGELGKFAYNTTEYGSAAEFDAFIRQARERSMYRIADDVTYGDSLLVLSTCDYMFYGDRLVIVARKLRDGESADAIDPSVYEENEVMKWPDVYYTLSYATGTRPTDEAIDRAYTEYYGQS